jgi:hypothetical protein
LTTRGIRDRSLEVQRAIYSIGLRDVGAKRTIRRDDNGIYVGVAALRPRFRQ